MNKAEFINKMNKYGSLKLPFLFIIDFDFNKPIITPLEEVDSSEILFQTEIFSNYTSNYSEIPKYQLIKEPISFEKYLKAFNYVQDNIQNGNSYLLNLTFPTKINLNLNLHEIFVHSKAKYKLMLKDQFVCFSPEIFVKIGNEMISSFPMKGTIDADIDNALEIILNDEKEFAEHNTIVDLIRNDLSIISKNVRVTKFRYPDFLTARNKNLIQISSEICGDLPSDYTNYLGTIFEKLLPAGSISGAPKSKTIEIIKKAEQYERGYYTGIFGVFDGENLDSGVIIRYIEQSENGYFFKSGGGITAMSKAQSEYDELIQKVYVPIY